MALRATFTDAPDGTKLRESDQHSWVEADVNDTLEDGYWSKNSEGDSYKIDLEPSSEFYLEDVKQVTLDGISGKVGYKDSSDNWNTLGTSDEGQSKNVKAVAAGTDGSIGIAVLDGSRGAFRPPTWLELQTTKPHGM